MGSSDGRFYSATINSINLLFPYSRFPIQIWSVKQGGYIATIGAVFSKANDSISIIFNSANATYNTSTKTITVDQESNAWASPIIVYPLSGIIFN